MEIKRIGMKNMGKVLITGHRGFIGSVLNQRLLDKGYEVMGVDIKDGVDCADVTNLQSFLGVTAIFHLAAHTQYPKKNTIEACHGIIDFYKSLPARSMIIYASSAAVYNPWTMYGVHKLYGENLFRSELEEDELTILRLFNVYGGNGQGLVDKIMRKEHIKINGSGEQRRDYVHVNDVVDAMISVYENDWQGTLDIGTELSYSVNSVLGMAGWSDYEYVEGYGGVHYSKAKTDYTFPWKSQYNISSFLEEWKSTSG